MFEIGKFDCNQNTVLQSVKVLFWIKKAWVGVKRSWKTQNWYKSVKSLDKLRRKWPTRRHQRSLVFKKHNIHVDEKQR